VQVPLILKRVQCSATPWNFTVNLSRDYDKYHDYPTLHAVVNFLWWHTRPDATIIVFGDDWDHLAAPLMNNSRVVACLPTQWTAVDQKSVNDAMRCLALMQHPAARELWQGYTVREYMEIAYEYSKNMFQHSDAVAGLDSLSLFRSMAPAANRFKKGANADKHFCALKCQVGIAKMPDGTDQLGLFANLKIEKDEILGKVDGFYWPKSQHKKGAQWMRPTHEKWSGNMFAFDHQAKVLRGLEFIVNRGSGFAYVNTYQGIADKPNVVFGCETYEVDTETGETQHTLHLHCKAVRDIEPGEQLLVDYGKGFLNEDEVRDDMSSDDEDDGSEDDGQEDETSSEDEEANEDEQEADEGDGEQEADGDAEVIEQQGQDGDDDNAQDGDDDADNEGEEEQEVEGKKNNDAPEEEVEEV
jgi:segregation and condensation protein B